MLCTKVYSNNTEAGQLTFQQSARMPPSNGIPGLNKEKDSQIQTNEISTA